MNATRNIVTLPRWIKNHTQQTVRFSTIPITSLLGEGRVLCEESDLLKPESRLWVQYYECLFYSKLQQCWVFNSQEFNAIKIWPSHPLTFPLFKKKQISNCYNRVCFEFLLARFYKWPQSVSYEILLLLFSIHRGTHPLVSWISLGILLTLAVLWSRFVSCAFRVSSTLIRSKTQRF